MVLCACLITFIIVLMCNLFIFLVSRSFWSSWSLLYSLLGSVIIKFASCFASLHYKFFRNNVCVNMCKHIRFDISFCFTLVRFILVFHVDRRHVRISTTHVHVYTFIYELDGRNEWSNEAVYRICTRNYTNY